MNLKHLHGNLGAGQAQSKALHYETLNPEPEPQPYIQNKNYCHCIHSNGNDKNNVMIVILKK